MSFKDICRFFKNPVVLLLLFFFGFIQFIVLIAIYNAPNVTVTRILNIGKGKFQLDWRFRTGIKVDVINETVRYMGDYIQYGSEDFQYPLLVDMLDLVAKVKANKTLSVKPINIFKFDYLIQNKLLCKGFDGKLDLLILIKSKPENFEARNNIRNTWARLNCWGGRNVRHVFLFGSTKTNAREINRKLKYEHLAYHDVLQGDFLDTYYNNTLKLMMGLEWSVHECYHQSTIFSFIDDDYLVQPRMVLNYIDSLSVYQIPRLFSGYVWRAASPQRSSSKKWFVSRNEYPWSSYPPYCSAGHFFVSKELAQDISIAMKYTKFLRFDDVFLGLVLHKLLITPMHINSIYSFNPLDASSGNFANLISSHGYKNQTLMLTNWIKLRGPEYCSNVISSHLPDMEFISNDTFDNQYSMNNSKDLLLDQLSSSTSIYNN